MSLKLLTLAACAAIATPVAAQATTRTPPKRPAVSTSAPAKAKAATPDPAAVMASMMKVMDLMFPAGPEPEPARLAAARQATLTMFPAGTYAQAVNGFIDRTVDHVLNMSEADFAAAFPDAPVKKGAAGKPPSVVALRVKLAEEDPSFDAKLAAGKAFVQTTMVKLGAVAEPRFREGMARALARKFDARQLAEIQGFLATPTGAAYGREMVGLWFEPDVFRGSIEAMPEFMKLMPDIAKDGAALGEQMKAGSKPK